MPAPDSSPSRETLRTLVAHLVPDSTHDVDDFTQ